MLTRAARVRQTAGVALVYAVVVLHACVVVLLLTGALLALRCRRVLLAHTPVAAVVAAVHLAGADCPLTTWERVLRERAAGEVHAGGFLDHYVLGPLGLDAADSAVHLGLYAVVVLPNLLGYGLIAARTLRGPAAAQAWAPLRSGPAGGHAEHEQKRRSGRPYSRAWRASA